MTRVLKNLRIMSLMTGEYIPADLLIRNSKIESILPPGTAQGENITDCSGKTAVYGFADAHFHAESTMLTLPRLAEVLLQHGTTAIYINPHEIANVGGIPALREMLNECRALPLRIYIVAPCKVPTVPLLEASGAEVGLQELREMLCWPETVGIGELDAFKLLSDEPRFRSYIEESQKRGLKICGSISGFSGAELEKCIAAGITDDHESVTGEEALEKLRLGCCVHVREGSAEHNLRSVMSVLRNYPSGYGRICFCCDDRTASDLLQEGHIDHCIRESIRQGLDPFWAYRMGSSNPAAYYHQEERFGLIAPGKIADLVLVDDVQSVHITDVFSGGMQVVRDGELIWHADACRHPSERTIVWPENLTEKDLRVPSRSGNQALVNLAEIMECQIGTRLRQTRLPVSDGTVLAEGAVEYYSLAERYRGKKTVVNGFLSGFGLKRGAIAQSINHDNHHLVSVGKDRADMTLALNRVAEIGGGIVLALEGRIIGELQLPYWGLLTDLPAEETATQLRHLRKLAGMLGYDGASDPFSLLSLIALPVIPEAGFTDRGMIDVRNQRVIPVVIS